MLKLYTGETAADAVLRELVGPIVGEALETGAMERWFFVRYADPDRHLRLRFQGDPRRLHAETLPALQSAAAGPAKNVNRGTIAAVAAAFMWTSLSSKQTGGTCPRQCNEARPPGKGGAPLSNGQGVRTRRRG